MQRKTCLVLFLTVMLAATTVPSASAGDTRVVMAEYTGVGTAYGASGVLGCSVSGYGDVCLRIQDGETEVNISIHDDNALVVSGYYAFYTASDGYLGANGFFCGHTSLPIPANAGLVRITPQAVPGGCALLQSTPATTGMVMAAFS